MQSGAPMQQQSQPPLSSALPTPGETLRLLYPKREAARMLGISVRKLDYLIAQGRLSVSRIDGRVLVARCELERFARAVATTTEAGSK